MTKEDLLKINQIAKRAGEAILQFYDHEIDVKKKDDNSPLTKADMEAHHVIIDGLKGLFPKIPIISEESGLVDFEIRKNWKQYFLVDPLDGTKEFIKKNGEFTVNIALIVENEPVFGVVHLPAQKITYFGGEDLGSYKQFGEDEPIPVSHQKYNKSKPATIVVSRSHGSDETVQTLSEMGIKVKEELPSGSSIKLCLVAEGKADLYPRLGPTMEWDTAAGDAVYRYSCKPDPVKSSLKYNKESLKNPGFILGL
jgi:3'(2'), 5'-bisphosphate nucleotidase